MNNIGIFAGDLRQHYIALYLEKMGMNTSYVYRFHECDMYVVPTPFTRDGKNINAMLKENMSIDDFLASLKPGNYVFGGNIPSYFVEKARQKNVLCHDFLKESDVAWANAYLTAEGLIAKIINETPFSLKEMCVFIIGYGKCGSTAARLLMPLCKKVFVYDHTPKHIHKAAAFGCVALDYKDIENNIGDFDILINTVPKPVLNHQHYILSKKDCFFFEIASTPYGFDSEEIRTHNRHLITCPGIPGKTSPKTAGEIISKNILEYLLERNDNNEP